jgi:hypothetical protein
LLVSVLSSSCCAFCLVSIDAKIHVVY